MSDGPSFGPTSYPEKVQVEKVRISIIITITITITIQSIEMGSSMAATAPKMLARPSDLRIAIEGQVVSGIRCQLANLAPSRAKLTMEMAF